MMRVIRCLTLLASALLAACTSAPPAPAWRNEAYGALQSFTSAYLEGNTRAAEAEFARARRALSATGRAELVAQGELIRCAVRTASLEIGPCTGFEALAADASAQAHAYAAYLAGRWDGLDAQLLPAQHRALLAAGGRGAGSRLAALEDPLARLVAAGAMLQNGRLTPTDIEVAVATASEQGWRRPLLAWLGVQARRAEQAGAHDDAARIRRRMDLVGAK